MHLNLAHTFLEVIEQGNFNAAAERLGVTASSVSMRIRALEDLLGRKLLVRRKSGTELTAAGLQFRPHAEMLVKTWQRAAQEIALPARVESVFAVGGEYSLWDSVLVDWAIWFRDAHPKVALRADVSDGGWITRQLSEGLLDLGILYNPHARSGLVVEPLFEEQLILVSTKPRKLMRWSPDYVYSDWGIDFREAHGRAYPYGNLPSLTGTLGPMTIRYMLKLGGSGYFPEGSVRRLIRGRKLFLVGGAPRFSRKVYGVYPGGRTLPRWFSAALDRLRNPDARLIDQKF
jgi:DNA-binding transcriptional LysR family regulator